MPSFSVDRPTVVALVGNINTTFEEIQTLVSSLNSNLQDVLTNKAVWAGDGQVAFVTVQTEWDDGVQKINTALQDIATQLTAANAAYGTSDSQSQSAISSASSGLSGIAAV